MERKVNNLENCHVEVVVTVDEKTWVDAQEKSFKKVAANVTLPGFRKGKAPLNMLRGKVDQMKVIDGAINDLLPKAYEDILKNEKIRPAMGIQPKVDVTKLTQTELELKFVIVTVPTVELGAYSGLELGKKEIKVSAKEVNEAMNKLLEDNGTWAVKEDAAANGDIVVIDFEGFIDGVAFDGGKAEGHELLLGSNSFVPGFESGLVGIKAGETRELPIKFPENYVPELKGKDATFTVKCNEVKAKNVPELTDDFAKDLKLDGVDSIETLKARKKADLENQKQADARKDYLNALLAKIAEGSKIAIADEIINQQAQARRQEEEKRISQSGLTFEQYLSILGKTEESYMAEKAAESRKDFTNFLVMDRVGAAEKIAVNNEDLEAEMKKIGDQYKMSVEDVKKALGQQIEEYRSNIRMARIEEFLYTNNK